MDTDDLLKALSHNLSLVHELSVKKVFDTERFTKIWDSLSLLHGKAIYNLSASVRIENRRRKAEEEEEEQSGEYDIPKPIKCFGVELDLIPKFDGSILNWTYYSTIMNIFVIHNPELIDKEKLAFIGGTVIGDAIGYVHKLIVKHHDSKKVWSILEDRYEDLDYVMDDLLVYVRKFPEVTSNKDLVALKTSMEMSRHMELVFLNTTQDIRQLQPGLIARVSNNCPEPMDWEINCQCDDFEMLTNFFERKYHMANVCM